MLIKISYFPPLKKNNAWEENLFVPMGGTATGLWERNGVFVVPFNILLQNLQ